jgi:hypothetical protein
MLVTVIRAVTRAMPKVFVMIEPHPEGSIITKTVPHD